MLKSKYYTPGRKNRVSMVIRNVICLQRIRSYLRRPGYFKRKLYISLIGGSVECNSNRFQCF